MTTATFSSAPSNASDTSFRAWISAIIDALEIVGLVRTADTGQIDAATVTRPATANTVAGYAVFRFDDALQATHPLFIKLEFMTNGHTTVASGGPLVQTTIGKSTDGAGALSGVVFGPAKGGSSFSGTSSVGVATSYNGVAAGGESYVGIWPWMGMPNAGTGYNCPAFMFHIERTNDGEGLVVVFPVESNVGTGATGRALLATTSFALAPRVYAINYATGAANVGSAPVNAPQDIGGTALGGSTALAASGLGPVFPWVVFPPALPPHQCRSILTYPGGDTPPGVFQVTLGGVERDYFPITLSDNHNAFGVAMLPNSGTSILISRYLGAAICWD